MKYGMLALILVFYCLIYIEVTKLKRQMKFQQKQLNKLCDATGNKELSTYFISDDVKEVLIHLKNAGKEVEAVRKVREITSMDLIEAKEYIDKL